MNELDCRRRGQGEAPGAAGQRFKGHQVGVHAGLKVKSLGRIPVCRDRSEDRVCKRL